MPGRGLVLGALLTAAAGAMAGAQTGLMGNWETPGGSVMRAYGCGSAVCLKIVKVEPGAQATDTKNPEAGLRTRPLCGLEIGTGFQPKGANEAGDGQIYDPDSGRTYKGAMRIDGTTLKLRGSYGVFWRTEVWKRTGGKVEGCGAG